MYQLPLFPCSILSVLLEIVCGIQKSNTYIFLYMRLEFSTSLINTLSVYGCWAYFFAGVSRLKYGFPRMVCLLLLGIFSVARTDSHSCT